MLNYIWAGLIISSFVFALGYDARDLATRPLPQRPAAAGRSWPFRPAPTRAPGACRWRSGSTGPGTPSSTAYQGQPADSYPGTLRRTQEGTQLRFAAGATLSRAARHHRQGLEVAGRRAAGPAGGRHRRGVPAGVVREAQRHRRRGAGLRQDGGGDRAGTDRRAGPLPGNAQDRRAGRGHLRAGEAGAAGAPPAFPRAAARPSGAGHDRPQHGRQRVRPRQRGHARSGSRRWRSCRSSTPARTPPPIRW